MPTYDYECQKCGKVFEHFQSMSSDPLTDCNDESCDGKVIRLIGAGSGLIFKGSGFYITDYKNKSGSPSSPGTSGSSSGEKSGSSESGSSESSSSSSSSSESKSSSSEKSSSSSKDSSSGSKS